MLKPPLGLIPRKIHNQHRANAIHEAVNRYISAGMAVPIEWIEEYNELVNHASDQSVFNTVHDVPRPDVGVTFLPKAEVLVHLPRSDGSGLPLCGSNDGATNADPDWATCEACLALR